ncbi:MAG: hypothetical protein JWO92_82 [Chitinophagaceae bacterium]|nr:hypothetical protein [Chitinophagaceae bacterium]
MLSEPRFMRLMGFMGKIILMKKLFIVLLITAFLFSCKNKDIPDVSNIKVDLKVQRFEKDFFAIDTNNILNELQRLRIKYPSFLNDFTNQILGFDNTTPPDSLTKYIHLFIRDYRFVKDSADKLFENFESQAEEIKKGLQFVKYYFPEYKVPNKVITFIGPFDGYSDVITSDAFAIGLQLHMGSNFSFYKSDISRDIFPEYISRKFTPEYIPINCIQNVIDDMYPDKSIGKALIEQMVEKGKRLYLLDKFLPYTPEYLKIGYTETQLKDSYANEAVIWDFFLNNDLLNNTDQNIVKNYIGESPKTQELGEGSPGNIGAFSGWQIVKKYMDKNSKTSLQELMKTNAREIYSQSKYKPRN